MKLAIRIGANGQHFISVVEPAPLRKLCLLTFAFLITLITLVSFAAAQEWTRFHGPNGQGVATSDGEGIPSTWTAKDYDWQIDLPGIGHSSPVIWGEKVFVLGADPKTAERYVVCIHAEDGSILWKRSFASATHHLHTRSSYASCTPAVDADRVYVAWSSPEEVTLMALTHDGEDAWSRDLGTWVSQHGFGTSPILYEGKVILSNQQQAKQLKAGQKPGASSMIAVDAKTGKDVWQSERTATNVCYTVPCLYTPQGGETQLICCSTGEGIYALDPDTGKKLWDAGTLSMRTVASPILVGDKVFGSTGSGGGGNYVIAVQLGDEPKLSYELKGKFKAPYVPTSVAKDGYVYFFYDKGFVSCVEAKSGEETWSQRVGAGFSGSPILVGDRIFAINEEGEVLVIAANSKQYDELGRTTLGQESRCTPAVSAGRLFLKTDSKLFAIGG